MKSILVTVVFLTFQIVHSQMLSWNSESSETSSEVLEEKQNFFDDRYCDNSPIKLQIALLFNRSPTFHINKDMFVKMVRQFTNGFKMKNKGSAAQEQFALIVFSDKTTSGENDDCYKVVKGFNSEATPEDLSKELESISTMEEDFEKMKTSLTPIYLAATDKSVGWEPKRYDSKGRRVHKFILLATDEASKTDFGSIGGRSSMGQMGCDTPPPTQKVVEEALLKSHVSVIGLLVPDEKKGLQKFFKSTLGRMEMPYSETKLEPRSTTDEMFQAVQSGMQRAIFSVTGDPPPHNTLGY